MFYLQNLEKASLIIIRWGSYLILFLPFLVYRQTLFPYVFPKIIVFQIVVEILLIFWLILAFQNHFYRPDWKNPLILFLTVFIAVLFLTSLTGADFSRSFWSTPERMTGVFAFLHFYLWFLILTSTLKSWQNWRALIWVSLISSFLVGLYGLIQETGIKHLFSGQEWRLSSTFGNPIFLSAFALCQIFLAGLLFFKERKWLIKILALALFFFNLLILLLTASRAAIFAFFLSLILFLIFLVFISPHKKLKIISVIFVIIFILSFVLFASQKGEVWLSQSPYFLQRAVGLTSNFWARAMAWQIGLEGFKEKPLLGWGWENYNIVFNKYYHPAYLEKGLSTNWFDKSHNQLIDLLSLAGILGTISYLAVFFFLFKLLFRKTRADQERTLDYKITTGILGAMFFAYFLQNLFIFDTPGPLIIFYFSLGLAYFITEPAKLRTDYEYTNNSKKKRATTKETTLIFLFIFLLPLAIYHFNLKPFWQSRLGVKAAMTSGIDFPLALTLYQKALLKPSFVSPEIRIQLADSIMEARDKGIGQHVFENGLSLAISEMEKSVIEHPLDAHYYLYLGQLYNMASVLNKRYLTESEKILEEGLKLAPKHQEIYYELGWTKLRQEKYQEAISAYQTALSFNENLKESHWYLGLAYLGGKEYKKGAAEIEKAYQMFYPIKKEPEMLLLTAEAYAKLGNYQRAIYFCNFVLKFYPQNTRAMEQKVLYLAKSGNKNQALKLISEISKTDKSLAEELQKKLKAQNY